MGTGNSEFIISSYATSNSYAYSRRVNVRGYAEWSLTVIANQSQSGVTYIIRGYPAVEGSLSTLVAPSYQNTLVSDTAMVSGDIHYLVCTRPIDEIQVGVKSTATNYSGRVSVILTGKRRGG